MDTPYAYEDYAICVNKSNYELLGKINKALKELKSEGKLDEIINKYLPETDEEWLYIQKSDKIILFKQTPHTV